MLRMPSGAAHALSVMQRPLAHATAHEGMSAKHEPGAYGRQANGAAVTKELHICAQPSGTGLPLLQEAGARPQ